VARLGPVVAVVAVVAAAVRVAGMVTLLGRRGTWGHRRTFCVAGFALVPLGWLPQSSYMEVICQ
jgi:uncharacterized membrane protein